MRRSLQQARPAPEAKQRYFIYDTRATSLVYDGQSRIISDEDRKDGVLMTPSEAAYYVANSTLGETQKPKSKEAQAVVQAASGENPIPEKAQVGKA